jgi:hypothetical protein
MSSILSKNKHPGSYPDPKLKGRRDIRRDYEGLTRGSSLKSHRTNLQMVKVDVPKVQDKVSINPKNRYTQFLKENMPYTKLESNFRTKGKQKLLEGQTTRKGLGAGLLKEIKRKLMKHIPGRLKKTN